MGFRCQAIADTAEGLVNVGFVWEDEDHCMVIIDIRAGINFRVSACETETLPGNAKALIDGYRVGIGMN